MTPLGTALRLTGFLAAWAVSGVVLLPSRVVAQDFGSATADPSLAAGSLDAGLSSGQAATFGANRPGYKLLRYDEDWSFLRDPARRTDPWDGLKYVPLGPGDYLTLGGEVREWFESYRHDSFGLGDRRGTNTFHLERYMLHADLHLGESGRLFAQTVSGFEDGRVGGPRPDTDRNQLDLHQAFLDWTWSCGGSDAVTGRLGRQEFEYGTGRLIDVREGPNLRRSFDAARVLAKAGGWAVDGWWGKPARNRPGSLDDDADPAVSFWGVYGVRPDGDGRKPNLDLYYLGFQHEHAAFDQGSGDELRHSVGTRVWGKPENWEYNLEYVGQFGTFAGGRVAAWTAANAARYSFNDLPLAPRPGLRFDAASGDRNPGSRTLNTFNPLFPAGAYFNLTGPFGPENLIDLHPTLDLTLSEEVTLSADWNFFWRQSTEDGVYRLSGTLLAGGQKGRARYVGSSPAVTAVWTPAAHVAVLTSYVHVFPGEFLNEATPGEAVDYLTARLTYKF